MQLQSVLNAVRKMRNKLLLAHQSTEVKLASDAKSLLSSLESAIADIDTLHAEVGMEYVSLFCMGVCVVLTYYFANVLINLS